MQITPASLTIFWFWFGFAFILWMPLTLLIMAFITPKPIMQKYFKTPHFNNGELTFYAYFPGMLLRTFIFMLACHSKRHVKGRQLTGYSDIVPKWYVVTSGILLICILGSALLLIALLIGLLLYPADT